MTDLFASVSGDTRQSTRENDDIYTPGCATALITPYLRREWTLWECCYGLGYMADDLKASGFKVVGAIGEDCFTYASEYDYDCIITNPPYSQATRNKVIELCAKSDKPFALLIRNEHLGGVWTHNILKDTDIQLLIPNRRINFINPGNENKISFNTLWMCRGLDLPKPITFVNYINQFRR